MSVPFCLSAQAHVYVLMGLSLPCAVLAASCRWSLLVWLHALEDTYPFMAEVIQCAMRKLGTSMA